MENFPLSRRRKTCRILLLHVMLTIAVVTRTIKGDNEGPELSSLECEYIVEISWDEWTKMGDLKCCFMQNDVEIGVKSLKIANVDDTVTALDFSHSKKIHYLPIDVNESFVNLKALAALECQIGEISDVNFRGLAQLKFLDLTENLIETIPPLTFDDLVSLEYLALSDNRIQLVNGIVFAHLSRLRKVLLVNNPCIDEVFIGTCSIGQIPTIVDRKCGDSIDGNRITCSRVLNSTWSDSAYMDERRDCELDEGLRIDTRDFHFVEGDESVTGLVFSFNRNVFYLPVNVSASFENLQAYVAVCCSVEDVFVENFEGLVNLIMLDLRGNKIQSVASAVFGDLVALKFLRLSQNKIKFMNGEVVAPLKSLQHLYLEANDCIDQNFLDESFSYEGIAGQIDMSCGFVRMQTKLFEPEQQQHELSIKNVSEQITELKKSVDRISEILTGLHDNSNNKVGN